MDHTRVGEGKHLRAVHPGTEAQAADSPQRLKTERFLRPLCQRGNTSAFTSAGG